VRRTAASSALIFGVLLMAASPVGAQTETAVLDRAATSLRRDPVYVDDRAERTIDASAADRLRRRIRDGDQPVFLAVLPSSAVAEAGNVNRLPEVLAGRVNLAGTYGVIAGGSFRAGSTSLPPGRATSAATAAFQAHSGEGTEAVLADFVERVASIRASAPPAGRPATGRGARAKARATAGVGAPRAACCPSCCCSAPAGPASTSGSAASGAGRMPSSRPR
jgi:hypothetical protein